MESSIRELDGRTGHPIHRTGRTSGVREVPGDEGGERPVEVELLAGPRVAVHPFHRAHLLRRRSPRVTAHAPVDNSDAAEARPEPQFDPSAAGSFDTPGHRVLAPGSCLGTPGRIRYPRRGARNRHLQERTRRTRACYPATGTGSR